MENARPLDDNDAPTLAEVLAATSVLQRLRPNQLEQCESLVTAGKKLFGKLIRTELYANDSSVGIVQRKAGIRQMVSRLERLNDAVQLAHAETVETNSCSGINVVRESRTAAVNTEGLAALSTQAGLTDLYNSASNNRLLQQGGRGFGEEKAMIEHSRVDEVVEEAVDQKDTDWEIVSRTPEQRKGRGKAMRGVTSRGNSVAIARQLRGDCIATA
jgi:hypothetical protein